MKKQDNWIYFVLVFVIGMAAGSFSYATTPGAVTVEVASSVDR